MTSAAITQLHELLQQGAGICTDSRLAASNTIFFALKGQNFDGNGYAAAALEKGCTLSVVDDPNLPHLEGFLLVEDVLKTLQDLGSYHRSLFNIPVIGITGSNGKTTTKELLLRVLSKKYATHATCGNLNNHIGVPLTLLSWQHPLDLSIVEMGANHMGEIASLCQISKPGFGLITNIGKAHLEGFGSLANVAIAKGELYQYISSQQGILFVNADHEQLIRMAGNTTAITYGKGDQNNVTGRVTESFPFVRMEFYCNNSFGQAEKGMKGTIQTKLTGAYNAENILAALTMGLYFGVSVDDLINAIQNYQPQNNRSQIVQTKSNQVIMDAYNANPTSMMAALENFSHFKDLPRVAILGDMLEMGKEARHEHEAMARLANQQGYDLVLFVGPHFSESCSENGACKVFPDVNAAAAWLLENPLKGYRILVKGSRGIQLEKLIQHL